MDLPGSQLNILAIGAHPDDVELGCFGTLARCALDGHQIHILVMSNGEKGGSGDRKIEARNAANLIGASIYFGDLEDTNIKENKETIAVIEKYVKLVEPVIVFINSPSDGHQDHRNITKSLISCQRLVPTIYFYETPSTIGFKPCLYVEIKSTFETKIEALDKHTTQTTKHYMEIQTQEAIAKFRGSALTNKTLLVEAFEAFKIVIRE